MSRSAIEINRAVNHCNELESNIKNCLQVLQKICVKKPKKGEQQGVPNVHISKSEKSLPKLCQLVELKLPKKAAQTTTRPSVLDKRTEVTVILRKTKQKLERLIERQERIKSIVLSMPDDVESPGKVAKSKSTLLAYASGDGSTDVGAQRGIVENNNNNNGGQQPTCDGDASSVSAASCQ